MSAAVTAVTLALTVEKSVTIMGRVWVEGVTVNQVGEERSVRRWVVPVRGVTALVTESVCTSGRSVIVLTAGKAQAVVSQTARVLLIAAPRGSVTAAWIHPFA